MKKIILIFLLFLLFSCSNEKYVNIILTGSGKGNVKNDLVTKKGVAYFVNEIRQIKYSQKTKYNYLHFDTGDNFFGSPEAFFSEGQIIQNLLNRCGIDYSTIGNIDFSFGKKQLQNIILNLNYKILVSNVTTRDNNKFIYGVAPYSIIKYDKIKIGIIGMSDPNLASLIECENRKYLSVLSLDSAMENSLEKLVGNVDLVFVLGHFKKDEWETTLYKDIPAIVMGNIKSNNDEDFVVNWSKEQSNFVGVQSKNKFSAYTLIKLQYNKARMEKIPRQQRIFKWREWVTDIQAQKHNITTKNFDEKTLAFLSYWETNLNRLLNKFVCISEQTLSTKGKYSMPIGNFITDTLRKTNKTQIAFLNYQFIRAPLPKGVITEKDIYKSFPFPNKIVTGKITGKTLKKAIIRSIKSNYPLQISGFKVALKNNDVILRLNDGTLITNNTILSFSSVDFVVNGGDNLINDGLSELNNTEKPLFSFIIFYLLGKNYLNVPSNEFENRYKVMGY